MFLSTVPHDPMYLGCLFYFIFIFIFIYKFKEKALSFQLGFKFKKSSQNIQKDIELSSV